VLSLPNYPELTTAQRTRVADTVSEFLHQQAAIR
jgi:dTDP-4-amino-4,6-dideoxygalactose transaminase